MDFHNCTPKGAQLNYLQFQYKFKQIPNNLSRNFFKRTKNGRKWGKAVAAPTPTRTPKNVTMRFVPMIIPYVLVQKLRFYLLYNQSNSEFKTIDWIFYFFYQIQFVILSTLFYINLISSTPIFGLPHLYLWKSWFSWARFWKTIGR